MTLWLGCYTTSILVGNLLFDYATLSQIHTWLWLWLFLEAVTLGLLASVSYSSRG